MPRAKELSEWLWLLKRMSEKMQNSRMSEEMPVSQTKWQKKYSGHPLTSTKTRIPLPYSALLFSSLLHSLPFSFLFSLLFVFVFSTQLCSALLCLPFSSHLISHLSSHPIPSHLSSALFFCSLLSSPLLSSLLLSSCLLFFSLLVLCQVLMWFWWIKASNILQQK